MKILLVTEYYYPHIGGAETLFTRLSEFLVKKNHRATVVTIKVNNNYPDKETINEVDIIRIKCPQIMQRYAFIFLAIPTLLKLTRDADIIQTTTYAAAFPAWLCAKIFHKKVFLIVHEVFHNMWRRLPSLNFFSKELYRLFEKFIITLPFDKYICVSRYTQNCLKLLGKKDANLELIYNGIDYEFWNPEKYNKNIIRGKNNLTDEFIYLYYGRPGVSKGIEYLIQAVPEISKKIPNAKLMLIMSNDPEKRYNYILKIIKELNIEKNIILINSVAFNSLPDYLLSADCIVVPSLSEGFGYTVAESCALKKNIVACDTGSIPEIISGNYVLAKPGNPAAIAAGVQKIYEKKFDDQVNIEKKFTLDDSIEKYLELYKNFA